MSDGNDKKDPLDDVKKGFGFFINAAKNALGSDPVKKFEAAIAAGATAVERGAKEAFSPENIHKVEEAMSAGATKLEQSTKDVFNGETAHKVEAAIVAGASEVEKLAKSALASEPARAVEAIVVTGAKEVERAVMTVADAVEEEDPVGHRRHKPSAGRGHARLLCFW